MAYLGPAVGRALRKCLCDGVRVVHYCVFAVAEHGASDVGEYELWGRGGWGRDDFRVPGLLDLWQEEVDGAGEEGGGGLRVGWDWWV